MHASLQALFFVLLTTDSRLPPPRDLIRGRPLTFPIPGKHDRTVMPGDHPGTDQRRFRSPPPLLGGATSGGIMTPLDSSNGSNINFTKSGQLRQWDFKSKHSVNHTWTKGVLKA